MVKTAPVRAHCPLLGGGPGTCSGRRAVAVILGPILLGEDNEDDALLFRLFLKKVGEKADIRIVREARDVIAYVRGEGHFAERERFPVPKVIFLDGQLHHQPSFGILTLIREHPETRDVPVFVLTGSLDRRVHEEAKKLGATDCFEKPFGRQHLQRVYELVALVP